MVNKLNHGASFHPAVCCPKTAISERCLLFINSRWLQKAIPPYISFQLSNLGKLLAEVVLGECVINHGLHYCNSRRHLPVDTWLFKACGFACRLIVCLVLNLNYSILPCIAEEREGLWHSWHPRFDGFGLYHFIKVPSCTCFSIILMVAAPKPVFTASKKLYT